MGIVDDLLTSPGVYVGVDRMSGSDHTGVARIVVTALPGGAGVRLDYEVIAGSGQVHVEHTMIGRTPGGAVMVIGHTHGEFLAVLRETDPGVFELGDEPSPFPMKVVLSVPEPGRIRHAWWYGAAGAAPVERDVAEVTLQA